MSHQTARSAGRRRSRRRQESCRGIVPGNARRPSLRILCISPLFVPKADSEAFCAAKMAQGLLDRDLSVTVLFSSNIRSGGCTDSSRLWDSLQDVSVDVPQVEQLNPLHSMLAAAQFQTPIFARWIDAVVTTAKLLHQASKFDLVYSRSLPMVAHVAGYWCARKLRLPWVANINDPWELDFFPDMAASKLPPFTTRTYLFWLRRTLRHADLVTYPCEGLHDFHTRLAKLEHHAEIIPHIGSRPSSVAHSLDGHFRLVHAGKLGANEVFGRSTRAFLLGLKAFLDSSREAASRTRLVLVGPEDKQTQAWIHELGLQGHVENVGRVNYEDSLDYMASASACILIEIDMEKSIFFPSKLADYLVCRKPVLALSPRLGAAADLAGRGELVRVDHDPAAVCNALAGLYADFARGALNSRGPSEQLITELQADSVVDKFLAAAQSVLRRPATTHRAARTTATAKAGPSIERLC